MICRTSTLIAVLLLASFQACSATPELQPGGRVLGAVCEHDGDCGTGHCEPSATGSGRICCSLPCNGGRSCLGTGQRCVLCNQATCDKGCSMARCAQGLELGARCESAQQCASNACLEDYFGDYRCCEAGCPGACSEAGWCEVSSVPFGDCTAEGCACETDSDCASGWCLACEAGSPTCRTSDCPGPAGPAGAPGGPETPTQPTAPGATPESEAVPEGAEPDDPADPVTPPEDSGVTDDTATSSDAGEAPDSATPPEGQKPGAAGTPDMPNADVATSAGGEADEASGQPEVVCGSELLVNGDFEQGVEPWQVWTEHGYGLIFDGQQSANEGALPVSGDYLAWFGGLSDVSESLSQQVAVPAGTQWLILRGYALYRSAVEVQGPQDHMRVTLRQAQALAETLISWSNQDAPKDDWRPFVIRVAVRDPSGGPATLELVGSMGAEPHSNFYFDTLSLTVDCDGP